MKDKQIMRGMRPSVQKLYPFMWWEGNIKSWSNYILSGLYNRWNHGHRNCAFSFLWNVHWMCVDVKERFKMEERLGSSLAFLLGSQNSLIREHFHWTRSLTTFIVLIFTSQTLSWGAWKKYLMVMKEHQRDMDAQYHKWLRDTVRNEKFVVPRAFII